MSDGLTAPNGADNVRTLQRALYRQSKQNKAMRFDSLYDKVWRTAILGEAWREVKANHGAPGIDGKAIEESVETGQAEGMIATLQEALRVHRSPCAPVRLVEMPTPKGGTRPLGIAPGEDRVVQTAMKRVLEPIFAADFHDCSYGYRPKRDAQQASLAIREDLYTRAWGVVEMDFKAYCTSIPHGKLLKLMTKRIADGSMLKLITQTLQVGVPTKRQVVPTTGGVPQGSPISPLYRNRYLNLIDQLWHSRGYPEQCGATLHRYADEAMLVCRRSPQAALAAFETIATRMELTRNRDKTRVTRLTDGFDCGGCNCVKRNSPSSGKNTI